MTIHVLRIFGMLAFLWIQMQSARAAPALVHTTAGDVAGVAGDPEIFRGIPYAAPPIGPLRWREPQPPIAWHGVRDATRFGNDCAQLPWIVSSGQPSGEDCLVLNVWTPGHARAARLPVLVWIYGGGFIGGTSAYALYDGAALAREGVVVVSINYRIGILGFLAHPGLSAESPRHSSGNYGLLDQLAALAWVRDNIAAFGGDPKRITVFGESAGAASIAMLMTSPRARGLFRGAIIESPVLPELPTRTAAEAAGAKLGADIAALRAMRVEDLLKHNFDFSAPIPGNLNFPAPTLDDDVLPRQPRAVFAAGEVNPQVAVIVGHNTDEGRAFLEPGQPVSVAAYDSWLNATFGPQAAAIRALNPAATDAQALIAKSHVLGDATFVWAARQIARGSARHERRTFSYVFTRSAGGEPPPPTHAAELEYVFGTFGAPDFTQHAAPNAGDEALSSLMRRLWARFAATGDPNGPGLPRWPAYDGGSDGYLEFGEPVTAGHGWRKAELDAVGPADEH